MKSNGNITKINILNVFFTCVFLTVAIKVEAQTKPIQRDGAYYKSKGYQVFPEFGFAVKCLCTLGDISNQIKSDNDISYGCVLNDNSQEKLLMYQILVNRVPTGFIESSPKKKKEFQDKMYSQITGNKKMVVFNNVDAAVITYNHKNQFTGKGIVFIKNGATFMFNVMTNDGLEQKFNKLTSEIKFFEN